MKPNKIFTILFFLGFLIFSSCTSNKQEKNEKQEIQTESNVSSENETEPVNEVVPNDSVKVHDITEKKTEDKKENKSSSENTKEKEVDVPETDVYNEKLDPSPNEFVQVDTEAKPKNLEVIKSQIAAKVKELGLSGECSVGILVSTHGNYLKHYTFGTSHKKIELAVAENIVNLKFTPAKNKGEAVKMWYKIKFKF